jgi:hypothetical protein
MTTVEAVPDSRAILEAYFSLIDWELRKLIYGLPEPPDPVSAYLPWLAHETGDEYRARIVDHNLLFGTLVINAATAIMHYYSAAYPTTPHYCHIDNEHETVTFVRAVAVVWFNQLCDIKHWRKS